MSQAIVSHVRARYPTPLGASHWAFLNEVATALALGLVKKTTGTNVNGVSQDCVMDRTGRLWDILIDGEDAARPTFTEGVPIDPGRYVVPVWNGPTDPVDPPLPPSDDAELMARLDRLDAQAAGQRVLTFELIEQIAKLIDRLRVLEDRPAPTFDWPELVAEGNTSRTFAHGHTIALKVRRA